MNYQHQFPGREDSKLIKACISTMFKYHDFFNKHVILGSLKLCIESNCRVGTYWANCTYGTKDREASLSPILGILTGNDRENHHH